MNRTEKKRGSLAAKLAAAAAAAICVLFVGLVNGSEAFASDVSRVPVLGRIASALCFRSWSEQTQDYGITVLMPQIREDGARAEAINREIETRCERYADEARARALEYREAFLSTGGTEEEWAAHEITIDIGYRLFCANEDYLSFVVYGTESWSGAYETASYYHLDAKTMEDVTLPQLLGADWKRIADEQIAAQIAARTEQGEPFFAPEEGGFQGIGEAQPFYLNEAGRVVIVFAQYEIAPGFMGSVEFEIQPE